MGNDITYSVWYCNNPNRHKLTDISVFEQSINEYVNNDVAKHIEK